MMTDKVKDMIEKKRLQWVRTDGNTHIFHCEKSVGSGYWIVEITILEEFTDITQVSNKIKLYCSCLSFKYPTHEQPPDTCKHTDGAQIIMDKENLRRTYKIITVDNIDEDKEVKGVMFEQDGNGRIKIESDDD